MKTDNTMEALIKRERSGTLTDEDRQLLKEIIPSFEKAREYIARQFKMANMLYGTNLPDDLKLFHGLSDEESKVLKIPFALEGLKEFAKEILPNARKGRVVITRADHIENKRKYIDAEKRKDDANERLEEILNERGMIFAGVIQKLKDSERLFFMRLFEARFEMVEVTVFIPIDICHKKKIGRDEIHRKKYLQKQKIGRWRLPYMTEIAKETGTSAPNITQCKKRFFDKFPKIGVYYAVTEKAFNNTFEKTRLFEARQDQLSEFTDQKDKDGSPMENIRLNRRIVQRYEAKQFQLRHSKSYYLLRLISFCFPRGCIRSPFCFSCHS